MAGSLIDRPGRRVYTCVVRSSPVLFLSIAALLASLTALQTEAAAGQDPGKASSTVMAAARAATSNGVTSDSNPSGQSGGNPPPQSTAGPSKPQSNDGNLPPPGPADESTLVQNAQAQAAAGNPAAAVTSARRALAINPNDAAAQAIVSQYQDQAVAQQRVNNRLKELNFGAAPDPGSAKTGAPGANSAQASPTSAPARTQTAAGEAEAAATGANPQVRALLQNAATQLQLGDYTTALLTLARAHDLVPGDARILDLTAKASNEAKNPLGAIAAAGRALAINPADAAALREKAFAEMSLGQYDQALADASRAIELDGRSGLGYLYRAMIEEKMGRADDARRDYEAAESLDPTLTPLAQESLRRLGHGAASPRPFFTPRLAFRLGAVALSTLLIVLGLMGTATGRVLTARARDLLTPRGAAPEAVAATVAPGAFIGEHYRIVRELGRGGMGVVYEGFDETLRRPVAVKQLQREGRGDERELERFLHEARLVAQLKHPHIGEIYSVVGGGDVLLVFEFVDGQSLDRALAARRPTPSETVRLVAEVAGALDYAHARKIVHRDLKPANVMVASNGAAKVMDFGIAHQSRSGADATRTTFVSGTPPYMSPEQMMGSVSPAADVYALGAMTYEMLTGRRPFDGPDYMEQKLQRRYSPPTSLEPALPTAVDALISRALDPDPTRRPARASEFAAGLAEAFGATPKARAAGAA